MNYITVSIPASYGQLSLAMPVFRELQDFWLPERYIEREFRGVINSSFQPERAMFFGKCAPSLARGFFKLFPSIPVLVYSTLPVEDLEPSGNRTFLWGTHPLQSLVNVDNSNRTIRWVNETKGDLLAFVSGGTSALLCSPPPSWSLSEIMEMEASLLRAGAPIEKTNRVRIALSTLKGGGMAKLVRPYSVRSFVWCDVDPESYAMTGSAPFWNPRRSSSESCGEILREYGITCPKQIQEDAQADLPDCSEVAKLADGSMMVVDFARRLEEKGITVKTVEFAEGTCAEKAANGISAMARNAERPCMLVGNGEYPVKVKGNGKGGRCSHLAALMARELYDLRKWCFAAVATDGEDGNGGGGAVVHDEMLPGKDKLLGAIAGCSTAGLFEEAGALLPRITTRNNLRDLWFLSLEE
jgi:glycerate 2-kinase